MDIKVEVGPITLDTVIGEHRVLGDDGYEAEPLTLGDAIAKQIFADLKREKHYGELASQVSQIRIDEIRDQIKPIVEAAIATPIRKTNYYGEQTGEQTTLTELIVAEAHNYLTKTGDSYGRDKGTVIQRLVAEAVDKAIRAELADAIADEKAKVVAAVQAKAAELIAEAVKQGVGR